MAIQTVIPLDHVFILVRGYKDEARKGFIYSGLRTEVKYNSCSGILLRIDNKRLIFYLLLCVHVE